MSELLEKAREYEQKEAAKIPREDRPAFHLSPYTGWMNDPNGFMFYKGQYHLFYQYHPYDTNWGPMHWGHAVSKDLIHWDYLPAALAPDQDYDKDGCFSGSGVELPDGRQLLMYTGVKQYEENGQTCQVQTQCLAVGDGLDYEKYEGNPVLAEKDLPQGASKVDFRDPKLWKEEDGTYHCILGSRPADGSGQLLLYRSQDAFHWEYEGVFAKNENRFGKMWECPDFFYLDGKAVLLTSPQFMLPQGLEYGGGNGTVCMIGSVEGHSFQEERNHAVDYGIDFYAQQTVLAQDGRRIMIGWMQNWDTCCVRDESKQWFGQMSLPREVFIKNDRLYQQPIRELEELRGHKVEYLDLTCSDEVSFPDVRGRMADLELNIDGSDQSCRQFILRFAKNKDFYSQISYDPGQSLVTMSRLYSGDRRACVHERKCQVSDRKGACRLRLILDRYSAELFINDGEKTMTMAIFTDLAADQISFAAEGKVRMDLTFYELS